MQNQKVIEQLGYSPREAKVYLVALTLGEAHVSDIAEKVDLPRSSVQIILDKLHKNGLMNFYVMRRYKYWVAERPEELLKKIKEQEDAIREALPSLASLKKASRKKIYSKYALARLGPIRDVADLSVQPILITNSDIEIEYTNPAWEKLFGYTHDEVRGENTRILKSGKTPPEVYARMWKTLHAGKLFQSDEIIDKKKDGTFFNLLTTIFQIKYGGRTFYVQILDDVGELERVEYLQKKLKRVIKK